MKKILLIALAIVFTASFAYAEISAQTYTGNKLQNYAEQQVFSHFYNGSGTDITSNFVVILDTSATNTASNTTLGTYITTTTSSFNALFVGVTDEAIANGKGGRVCIRGPHKVYMPNAPSALGASLSTTTTTGAFGTISNTGTQGEVQAVALTTTAVGPNDAGAVLTRTGVLAEGGNNYWVWIR